MKAKFKRVVVVCVLIILCLVMGWMNKDSINKSVGEPIFYHELFRVNGNNYFVSYTDYESKILTDTVGGFDEICSFSKISVPQFLVWSKDFESLFYIRKGDLYSMDVEEMQSERICEMQDRQNNLEAVAENYAIMSCEDDTIHILSLDDGKERLHTDSGIRLERVLDVDGDLVLMECSDGEDYNLPNKLYLYDGIKFHDIVTVDSGYIASGCIVGDMVYYAPPRGNLYAVNLSATQSGKCEPVRVELCAIAALTECEDELICAIWQENSTSYKLVFFRLAESGVLEEFASWEEADYSTPYSCKMYVNDKELVCGINTQESIFECEVP